MLYLVPTRYSVLLTLYEFVLHNSCLVYATKVQINVRSTFGEYSLGINRDNARHTHGPQVPISSSKPLRTGIDLTA